MEIPQTRQMWAHWDYWETWNHQRCFTSKRDIWRAEDVRNVISVQLRS